MNKQQKIEAIQKVLENTGSVSYQELNCRTAPVTNYLGGGIVQVGETFNQHDVEVVNYQGKKEISSDFVSYDELCENCVDEIYELIEEYNVLMEKTMKRASSY